MDDDERLFIKIYKYGTYYNPAYEHYLPRVDVGCDRCLKEKITACIGWRDYDLCLLCISEIDIMNQKKEIILSDSSDSYD